MRESAVSAKVWKLILLNPLTHVVICFRDVYNAEFHALSWALFAGMTLVAFLGGGWIVAHAKVKINEYI